MKLERAEEGKEKLELLKFKKLRRKTYVDSLLMQFRSLENLKIARNDEVESLQKQVEIKLLEIAHFKFGITRMEEQAQQFVARCGRDENMMGRLRKEIEDMQTETDLDRELMNACLTFSDKNSEESKLLEQYCKEDEEKVRDCLFRIDKLAVEEDTAAKDLEAMELQMKGAMLEVSRLQQHMREMMAERAGKVDHWAKIKQQVHIGDKDMERLLEEMDSLAAKRAAKEEARQRQKEFYNSEIRNNHEMQKRLEATEMNSIKAKDFASDLEKKKCELLNQIQVFESISGSKRKTIKRTNGAIKDMIKQLSKVRDDVWKWRELAKSVEEKNSQVNHKNTTDEERLAELNKTLHERQNLFRCAEQNVIKLRELKYKRTQENVDLKAELDAVNVNVDGNSLYLNNLYQQLKNNQSLAHSQAQQIYDLEYKITQLNRRISIMEGTDTGPSEAKLKEVEELTVRRDDINKDTSLMRTRLLKQEEWIKILKKEVDQQETDRKRNEITLSEMMLYLHTTERNVEKTKSRKIETAAEMSSSRLKLRYITDKAETKLDSVTGMAVRNVELVGLFKERIVAVRMEREQLRAQCKRMEEQRSWLVKILRELEGQQRGVKTRFELLTLPMISGEKGDGDATKDIVQMQAAFFIKAAQEKQSIQVHKLQLMQDIQKVMHDNFRLRQFLQRFEKQTNQTRSQAFHVKQKTDLDDKQRSFLDELSFLKERLRAHEGHVFGYRDELTKMRSNTQKLESLTEGLQLSIRQETEELKNLAGDVDDQKKRLDRTQKQNVVMLTTIKKSPAFTPEILKVDIETMVYTDVERLLYSTISRFLEAYPQNFQLVEELFIQRNIQMSEELTKNLLRTASARMSASAHVITGKRFASAR